MVIPGAVVRVTPLVLMWSDFFAVVLTFPLAGIDGRLIGAVQWTRFYGLN